MISVCIPVYNFKIDALVKAIEAQMQKLNLAIELVVIDDASKNEFRIHNANYLQNHTYIKLPKNIGRSKIRNLFKNHTKNKYLLFLDCDVMILNPKFLEHYLAVIKPNILIYGGRTYPEILPHKSKLLSWRYGIEIESKSADQRKKQPYLSFMTHNFLIDKSIFNKVMFNENIDNYGHEDTFFGYELQQHQIEIIHIENPVLNIDIENNQQFVLKNEAAIKNLVKISTLLNKQGFSEHVKLLKFYQNINKPQIVLLRLLFGLFGAFIRKKMIDGWYSKKGLMFYKLGYFIRLKANT